jgi:hypothetical protein
LQAVSLNAKASAVPIAVFFAAKTAASSEVCPVAEATYIFFRLVGRGDIAMTGATA